MNKPTNIPLPRNVRRQNRRWVDERQNPMALGCLGCIQLGTCGGIFTKQKSFGCLDNCCGKPSECQIACPRNLPEYLRRMREVNTFDLANVPRHDAIAAPNLPMVAPLIYHGNLHRNPLELKAAAISLHELYRRRDGQPRQPTRAEVEKRFGLAKGTRIILVGCGPDAPIEAWWGLSDGRREFIKYLIDQGFEFATSPNYSLFADLPRFDDLYNIKKVAKAWQEFGDTGLACALHVNARTQRDYERYAEFIAERPEITHLAFEFGTGAGYPTRQPYHVQFLATIGRISPRTLHLTMVGGVNAIPRLAPAFASLTYIDTSAFVNTYQRKRLFEGNDGSLGKTDAKTEADEPLDELLRQNIHLMDNRISKLIRDASALRSPSYIAPKLKTPERMPFGKAAPPSATADPPKSSTRDPQNGNASQH